MVTKFNNDTYYGICGKMSMHLFHQKAEKKQGDSIQTHNPKVCDSHICKFYSNMILYLIFVVF